MGLGALSLQRAGAEGTGGRTLRGHGVLRALRAAGASVLPREVGWQGPRGSAALQVIGSLNPLSHAGTPPVTALQDPNAALSEARSAGEGPSWLLSPSPLPIAHVELWVDAAPALLGCQIISGHGHRRTRRGVRGCEPCRGCRGGHGRAGSCGPGPFPLCPPGTVSPRVPRSAARPPPPSLSPRRRLRARCVIRRSANSGATL